MNTYSLYNRAVYFQNNKAVGTGFSHSQLDSITVMQLPSDHYDFIGPVTVIGKTKQEIQSEVDSFMKDKRVSPIE